MLWLNSVNHANDLNCNINNDMNNSGSQQGLVSVASFVKSCDTLSNMFRFCIWLWVMFSILGFVLCASVVALSSILGLCLVSIYPDPIYL